MNYHNQRPFYKQTLNRTVVSASVKRIVKSICTANPVRCITTAMLFASLPAAANDFTAEKVIKEMDGVQRYAYVAGVVEGLAVARYMKDGKQKTGMNCIYDWFYDDQQTKMTIYAAFEKYPGLLPGAVINVLVKQKCGE